MKKTTLIIISFLLVSTFVHAQWANGTNIYNTNAGSVIIGATAPYTINASSVLFPSATPKLEIFTGTGGTTPFAEFITVRHPGATSDVISRQLGIMFKLSSESSAIESDKMGGLIVESANAFANSPTMSLVTANIRRLTIDQSGKIGIGTTTPSFPFQLYNTTARSTNSGASAEFGFDSFTSTEFQGSRLYLGRSRGTSISPFAVQSGDYLGFFDFYGHDGTTVQRSGQLILQVDGVPSNGIVPGAFRFTTAGPDGINAERMRINSAGNVGIASTAPISTFQVSSGAFKLSAGRAPGADLNYGTSYLGFNAARIGTGVSANWTVESDGAHNGGGVIYTDIFGTVSIAPIASAGTGTQTLADLDIKSKIAFRVSGTGNVGIGTTDNSTWNLMSSTYKLAVGGGIIASAITVKTVPNWPDYVFKNEYKLPSLSDVKSYIDQNHHLPEIPSAQQIEKDGLNVGEMNKLLLKKIEELTLYLIEKDKKEKEQEDRISKLEKAIQDSACVR